MGFVRCTLSSSFLTFSNNLSQRGVGQEEDGVRQGAVGTGQGLEETGWTGLALTCCCHFKSFTCRALLICLGIAVVVGRKGPGMLANARMN